MSESATQPGAQAGAENAAAGGEAIPESPRDARLRELSEARSNEVKQEAIKGQDDSPVAPEGDGAAAAGETAEASAGAGQADAEPTPTAPKQSFELIERDGQKLVKLKVYGRETELPLDEALRRAQKDVAGDVRLQDAARQTREARNLYAQAEQMMQQAEQVLARHGGAAQNRTSQGRVDALKAATSSMYEGDLDTAAQVLDQYIEGRLHETTPIVVQNGLRQHQAAAQQANFESDLAEAAAAFDDEFPEIASDPRLFAYADKETELILAEDPNLAPVEVMRRAGQRIREMVAPKAAPPPTREQRKASLPRTVSGVSAASPLGDPPSIPPPVTASSVIERMRQARGQA